MLMYYKEIEINQKMDTETRKYLSTISKLPEDMLHLHDTIFMTDEKVENIDLIFDFPKCDPYSKYYSYLEFDPDAWWNKKDLENEERLRQDATERANQFLENERI